MHKTTNRNVLTYLFATCWLYCPYFRSINFSVPFTVYEFCLVGLEFGLLIIFPKLYFRRFCGCRNFALQVTYAKWFYVQISHSYGCPVSDFCVSKLHLRRIGVIVRAEAKLSQLQMGFK